MEFPDIGVEFIPDTDCLRSTIITISLSCRIICFSSSFSCVLKTPAFRSFWNFCSSKEFFFPVGVQSGEVNRYNHSKFWKNYTTEKKAGFGSIKTQLACFQSDFSTFASSFAQAQFFNKVFHVIHSAKCRNFQAYKLHLYTSPTGHYSE